LADEVELHPNLRLPLVRAPEIGLALDGTVPGPVKLSRSGGGHRRAEDARRDQPAAGRVDLLGVRLPVGEDPLELADRVVPQVEVRAGDTEAIVGGDAVGPALDGLPIQDSRLRVVASAEGGGGQRLGVLRRCGGRRRIAAGADQEDQRENREERAAVLQSESSLYVPAFTE
jgi:hypothetical protein